MDNWLLCCYLASCMSLSWSFFFLANVPDWPSQSPVQNHQGGDAASGDVTDSHRHRMQNSQALNRTASLQIMVNCPIAFAPLKSICTMSKKGHESSADHLMWMKMPPKLKVTVCTLTFYSKSNVREYSAKKRSNCVTVLKYVYWRYFFNKQRVHERANRLRLSQITAGLNSRSALLRLGSSAAEVSL